MRIAKNFDNFVSECPYFNGNAMLIMDMDVNIKHKKKSKMDRENATVGHVHVVILQTKKVYRKMILPGKVESRKREYGRRFIHHFS